MLFGFERQVTGYSLAADTDLAGCPGVLSLRLPWCLEYAFALTQCEFDTSVQKLHPKKKKKAPRGWAQAENWQCTSCHNSFRFSVSSLLLLLLQFILLIIIWHSTVFSQDRNVSATGWTARKSSTFVYIGVFFMLLSPTPVTFRQFFTHRVKENQHFLWLITWNERVTVKALNSQQLLSRLPWDFFYLFFAGWNVWVLWLFYYWHQSSVCQTIGFITTLKNYISLVLSCIFVFSDN